MNSVRAVGAIRFDCTASSASCPSCVSGCPVLGVLVLELLGVV